MSELDARYARGQDTRRMFGGGTITNAVSTGVVVGGGGLVGLDNNIVINGYWDTQTSGQSGLHRGSNYDGKGLTTAQLQSGAAIFSKSHATNPDKTEASRTPSRTWAIKLSSSNASVPMKRLMVNPTPVSIATP